MVCSVSGAHADPAIRCAPQRPPGLALSPIAFRRPKSEVLWNIIASPCDSQSSDRSEQIKIRDDLVSLPIMMMSQPNAVPPYFFERFSQSW